MEEDMKSSAHNKSVAIIGSGYWGKNLIRIYNDIGALKLICERNETLLQHFKATYPEIETGVAYNDVLTRDDIDGIVIATPAETHYNLAREALLAGKHTYVEKPLVLDENMGQELIALAAENQRVLMVGHLLQYHPVFVKLKELAAGGELGRINYIYSNRLNLGKIRREENILWSFAPHDISMILSLAGEEPVSVHATGGNYLHKRIADVTTTHLEFPSGLKAHIFVSWLHPFKEQKLVVVGDRKMAVFDDTQVWEDKLLLYPHQINWKDNAPVPVKGEPERVDIKQDEPLKLECRHFLECIATGKTPLTDGNEGLRVLKILKAAQLALDLPVGADRRQPSETQYEDASASPLRQTGSPSAKSTLPADIFVHETAVVDNNCEIGNGTKIWHFSHVLSGSMIGEKCNIGQNVVIGPDVKIGKGCKIQNNVSVYQGVTLEDGVFCGPSMVFTNIYNPRAEIGKMDQVRPTLVKHGATIGANATLVCGVTLGRYAFIGAGAVVNKNVPDHAMIVGNPGRQIGWMCQCGERLTVDLECLECGKKYAKCESGVKRRR
jgi:UDP-2-acetamido-3-amino-2,3-dideoxy-glucuronate N-acetyltransferase